MIRSSAPPTVGLPMMVAALPGPSVATTTILRRAGSPVGAWTSSLEPGSGCWAAAATPVDNKSANAARPRPGMSRTVVSARAAVVKEKRGN
jgi:hypothetical protein